MLFELDGEAPDGPRAAEHGSRLRLGDRAMGGQVGKELADAAHPPTVSAARTAWRHLRRGSGGRRSAWISGCGASASALTAKRASGMQGLTIGQGAGVEHLHAHPLVGCAR